LRLRRDYAFGVQLLRDLLEAVSARVHGEDSPNDSSLIFTHFEAYTRYQRSPMLVNARRVFDRHVAISEASSAGV
jgi:hypothetical protein